jgi:Predicted membrane protein
MTLCGIVGGYGVAVSPRLGVAGMMAVLGFLLGQGFQLDPVDAPRALLAGTAGCLVQALLSAGVWVFSDRGAESPRMTDRIRAARRLLAENLTLASSSLRHALRWGIALGAAVAIYRFIDLQGHGYWIPLTVLFVLKPTTDDTWERVAMRTVGTIAGLVLATALAEGLGESPVPVALLLAGAAMFAYALLALEYALFTAAITVFVVLLTDSLGEGAFEAADQRAVVTLLGIAVAAVAIMISVRDRKVAPAR